jgi:hypothetical protein
MLIPGVLGTDGTFWPLNYSSFEVVVAASENAQLPG